MEPFQLLTDERNDFISCGAVLDDITDDKEIEANRAQYGGPQGNHAEHDHFPNLLSYTYRVWANGARFENRYWEEVQWELPWIQLVHFNTVDYFWAGADLASI